MTFSLFLGKVGAQNADYLNFLVALHIRNQHKILLKRNDYEKNDSTLFIKCAETCAEYQNMKVGSHLKDSYLVK